MADGPAQWPISYEKPMSQATQQRRRRILDELLDRKHVAVKDLAEDMAVSDATVRRDLKALADERQLKLVHGGATLPDTVDYSFRAKERRNLDAKRLIARLAADLIDDGDQLFLDSGTTCFELAGLIRRKRVSVLVNSARVALELNGPQLEVIMAGGQYRPDRMDTVGPIAMSTLQQLRGYRAFLGADGLSMDCGPTASDIESAHLYRLAVDHAEEVNLLVDHSKFARPSLCKIVDWNQIHRVVTDRRPDDAWLDFFHSHNIETIYDHAADPLGAPDRSQTDHSAFQE